MTVSKLITLLLQLKENHGDVPVKIVVDGFYCTEPDYASYVPIAGIVEIGNE